MLGAAEFVAELERPEKLGKLVEGGRYRAEIEAKHARIAQGLGEDHLTPVANRFVFGDTGSFTLPLIVPHFIRDRGVALEEAWSDRDVPRTEPRLKLNLPLGALKEDERAGWRPSIIFSPMLVEDGRRLLISNLDLAYLARMPGVHVSGRAEQKGPGDKSLDIPSPGGGAPAGATGAAEGKGTVSKSPLEAYSAVEFFKLFPKATGFQLGTATRMSATFPYVSPAVSLPTIPLRHVVDAGYYDNYGIDLASSWIYHNRANLRKYTSGVLLVQIRAYSIEQWLADLGGDPTPSWMARGFQWLTSEINGIMAARSSVQVFRNETRLDILRERMNGDKPPTFSLEDPSHPSFFESITFECASGAAPSWYVPEQQADDIRNCAGKAEKFGPGMRVASRKRMEELKEAFNQYLRNRSLKDGPTFDVKRGIELFHYLNSEKLALIDAWWKAPLPRPPAPDPKAE